MNILGGNRRISIGEFYFFSFGAERFMPGFLKVDSHHHFWRLSRGDYSWLTSELEPIYRDFLPDELAALLKACGVDKTVIVQAAETVEETKFILQIASEHDFVAGVVGWVNMEANDVESILDVFAKHPKFVGIRPVIQDIEDVNWMLKPRLDRAFQWIIRNGYTFDALVKPQHLDNLKVLLQRYPSMKVVIDHGAKPNISGGVFDRWAKDMQDIAASSQAYCKLSGLVTEAGVNPAYDVLESYMSHLLKVFGVERLMWGSDWPVCTLSSTYSEWFELSEKFLNTLNETQQQAIWGGNAQRFYELSL